MTTLYQHGDISANAKVSINAEVFLMQDLGEEVVGYADGVGDDG
jgi:hypothetical protein